MILGGEKLMRRHSFVFSVELARSFAMAGGAVGQSTLGREESAKVSQ
jgi:hypothetical protein